LPKSEDNGGVCDGDSRSAATIMAAAFVAAAAHESDGAPQATIVRTEHVQHFFSALLPPLDTVRQASRTERGTCIPTCAAISQLQSDGLALQRHGSY